MEGNVEFVLFWEGDTFIHWLIMQKYQSKLLRIIANATLYVTNHTLYSDLPFPYVRTVIHDSFNKHHITLASHPNLLMEPMLHPAQN
jgi:hypothetical protein